MLHLQGPADPLAAGFPALTQLHRQNRGGQQLGRGTEVGSIEQHADISICLCGCRNVYQAYCYSANAAPKENKTCCIKAVDVAHL